MKIIDAFGKIIILEENELFVGEYTKRIDLSGYPKGIYMIEMATFDTIITKRVVVH